jgi:hypothetical protein
MNRSVLTMASGKEVYINMAVNLARSFLIHHKNALINLYIATDKPDLIPLDIKQNQKIKIIAFEPGLYGEGFSTKLHLDKLAPTESTLFLDADCLLTGSLIPVFERLKGKAVSVIGRPLTSGEWFGDISHFCKYFEVKSIPGFNGCLYYIEKSDLANKVYEKARELESKYENLGMVLLRGKPNDELLISVAMAIYGLAETYDDGTIYGDPFASPGRMEIDVISGYCKMENPMPPNALNYSKNPNHITYPIIAHFLGSHTEYPPYTTQAFILKYYFETKIPEKLIRLYAHFKITIPYNIIQEVKKIFRPIYRLLLGTRNVKRSNRL